MDDAPLQEDWASASGAKPVETWIYMLGQSWLPAVKHRIGYAFPCYIGKIFVHPYTKSLMYSMGMHIQLA